MKTFPAAGLIAGPYPHHLDHLAPLCALLDIPLIVTEPDIHEAALLFYPMLTCQLILMPQVAEALFSSFDVLFSSLPKPFLDQLFFIPRLKSPKKLQTIWVPHGNSDKGHASFFMEGLAQENRALVYGNKMIDFLKEKKAHSNLQSVIMIGNYRLTFYQKHRLFYDRLAQEKILNAFSPGKQTVLYAPTWNDAENSSSLLTVYPALLASLPKEWNLMIKLHPHHLAQPHELIPLKEEIKKHSRVKLIESFPPIYPLLSAATLYLGDHSSIGYDFLSFKKPMFFLNQNKRDAKTDPGLYLFRCGTVIEKENYCSLFQKIEKALLQDQTAFVKRQEEVYSYTFSETSNLRDVL